MTESRTKGFQNHLNNDVKFQEKAVADESTISETMCAAADARPHIIPCIASSHNHENSGGKKISHFN